MLLDSESNQRPRVLGSFKYSGTIIGTVKWRSGRVQAREMNGSWILEFSLDTSDKTVLTVPLSAQTVEKVVCKSNHLMLEAFTKQNGQFLVQFKPQSDRAETELNKIYTIISQAQKPLSTGTSKAEVGLGLLNKSQPQAAKPLFSSYGGNSSRNITTSSSSPPRFTSMKENRKLAERHNDAKDEESKENRNTMSVSPSEKFLQRGTEKSREILSSFGTSGFYSSTPSKPSVLFTYSKKRTPGLMPDPKPSKPLLSENVSYSWSQQKTSQQSENKPIQTLHGFSNLGNTCYMNAILQSLYGLETFATDLLYTNHKLMKNFAPQSLYYSLAKLLNSRRTNIPDTIRRDLLRNVKTAISSTAKRFSGYQQHDAHEFLCQVLDQLKEEVIKVGKATPSPSPSSSEGGAAMSSANVKQDYVNPTVTNFEFEVRHSITCFQCGEEVTKTEQYNDISVDLLKTRDPLHPANLQQALDKFFRKECIEYTCEKCGHTKSEVAHKFVRLPRVFILHLKRYSYNCQISQNMKRGQSIGIPIYLTLQPHCEELTIPPLPPQLQLVYASPLKSCSFFENRTDDTTRRKLDYQTSGFKFKRIRSSVDSDEDSKHSPTKKLTLEHAVKDGTLNKIPKLSEKPLDIITDEDSELEKVLELSRREAEERKQLSEKSTGITDEDTELENILELSRREAEERKQMNENFNTDGGDDEDFQKVGATSKPDKGKTTRNDSDSLVYSMTEEEQINLAIQQSLMEPGFANFNEFCNIQPSGNGIGLSDHDSYSVGRKTEKVGFVNGKEQFHESGVSDVKNRLTKLTPKSVKDGICLDYASDDHEKLLYPISNTIPNGNVAEIESDKNKSERDQSFFENKPHCFEVDKEFNIQCEQEKENGTHSVEFDLKSEQVDMKKEKATQSVELTCTERKIDGGIPDIDLTCQEVDVYPPDVDDEELLPEVINNEKGELPYSYRLISIVNHVGTSSVIGHYVSDVYDIKKRSWFSFDDSHVTRTTEQEVQSKRERTGYIFFYISKDIFDDLQEHHKLSVATKVC